MKVLCLGGSGGMGRYATKVICKFPELEKLTIADINKSSAEEFAASLNSNVHAIGLDVTDNEKLSEALHEHDIVLNTTGPFLNLPSLFWKLL